MSSRRKSSKISIWHSFSCGSISYSFLFIGVLPFNSGMLSKRVCSSRRDSLDDQAPANDLHEKKVPLSKWKDRVVSQLRRQIYPRRPVEGPLPSRGLPCYGKLCDYLADHLLYHMDGFLSF